MNDTAEKVVAFIENFLSLTDDFSGQPFILLEWQKEFLEVLFTENESGEGFKYSSVLLEIPRKNAKTQIAAALALAALVGLVGSGRPEVVCAAYDKDQARILHRKCKQMIEQNDSLKREFQVLQSGVIRSNRNGGTLTVLSSEASAAHGMNPSLVICDELHTWRSKKSKELWGALTTGSGTRKDFLVVGITTAGYDKASLLGELRATGLSGAHYFNGEYKEGKESSFLYVGYGAEENEVYDPFSWEAFCKHNPSHEIVSKASFHSQCDLNKENEVIIRQLFHNEWIAGSEGWLAYHSWEAATDLEYRPKPGAKILVGVDASYSGDATAAMAVEIESGYLWPLGIWEKPENVSEWLMPLDELEKVLRQAAKDFEVVEFVFDPYWCNALMQKLDQDKFIVVKLHSNTPANMAPAVADFYHAVMSGALKHSGHPIVNTHVMNAASKNTPRGVVITKLSQANKIDAAVAGILAYSRRNYYLNKVEPKKRSAEIIMLEL